MEEICQGILRWDLTTVPEECYAYAVLVCHEGLYAFCSADSCSILQPGQSLLLRCSPATEFPQALTGREQGTALLLDPEAAALPGIGQTHLPELPDSAAVFADPRILSVCDAIRREEQNLPMRSLKLAELWLLLCETTLTVTPRICKREEFRIAWDAYRYAMERMHEHVTIQHMAARTAVSATKFKHCFQAVFGDSVFSCIRREKMYRAAAMLTGTDLKIVEIALETGYDNCSKFSRAFTGEFGCTPRTYRKKRGILLEHLE